MNDVLHRTHNGSGRLIWNAMVAVLNDDLLSICRQASQFALQLMHPDFVKLRDFLGGCRIVRLPILSRCKNDQWAVA